MLNTPFSSLTTLTTPQHTMAVLNPNNWHWVDKNTLPWTREYLEAKLGAFEVAGDRGTVRVVEVSKVQGDSNVSQRKGKPICYFDLQLEFKLELARAKASEEESEGATTGSIAVPEFMHDDPDFEINVVGFDRPDVSLIQTDFIPTFKQALLQYQSDLISHHSQDLQQH